MKPWQLKFISFLYAYIWPWKAFAQYERTCFNAGKRLGWFAKEIIFLREELSKARTELALSKSVIIRPTGKQLIN